MAKEDDVETFYRLSHLSGDIFLIAGGDDAAIPSTMEESYDDVSFLLLFQYLNPVACTLEHFVKVQPRPQTLVQPVGNGRCQHTQYGNTNTLALNDCIGLDIGFTCVGVNDVGT